MESQAGGRGWRREMIKSLGPQHTSVRRWRERWLFRCWRCTCGISLIHSFSKPLLNECYALHIVLGAENMVTNTTEKVFVPSQLMVW